LVGRRSVGGSTSIHRHHAHPNQEGLGPDIGGENLVTPAPRPVAGAAWPRDRPPSGCPVLPDAAAVGPRPVRDGRQCVDLSRLPPPNPGSAAVRACVSRRTSLLFLVLSPVGALVFVVVHQGLLRLYLGLVFVPNHKGVPIHYAAQGQRSGPIAWATACPKWRPPCWTATGRGCATCTPSAAATSAHHHR